MTSGSAEAREASSSTTSFRHRSPSISSSSLPSGSSPPSHRQSKRTLSNAAAAVVHHATNGSARGADGTSGGGPPTETGLSMSGALDSSPSTSSSSSSLGLQGKTGVDGHQRSPALSSIAEDQVQASGSGSSHNFANAVHSSSRRASGSCHLSSSSTSSSYDAADKHPQHHGRLHLHLPPRSQLEEEQEIVANYHTSSPLSEPHLALPDLTDYHSMMSHSRGATSLTDPEQAGRSLCGQRRPETVTAETFAEQIIAVGGHMVQPSSRSASSDHLHDTSTMPTHPLTTKDMGPDLPSSPRHPSSTTQGSQIALLPLQQSTVQQTSTASTSLPSPASPYPTTWSTWSFPPPRPSKAGGLHTVARKRMNVGSQSKIGSVGPRRASSRVNWETVVVDRGLSGSPTPNPWKGDSETSDAGPVGQEGLGRKRRLPSGSLQCNNSSRAPADQKGFQLQPVPPGKRRRYQYRPSQSLGIQHVDDTGMQHQKSNLADGHSCHDQPSHTLQHSAKLQSTTSSSSGVAPENHGLPTAHEAADLVPSERSEHRTTSPSSWDSSSRSQHAPTRMSQQTRPEYIVPVRENLFNVAGAKGTALSQMRCPSFFASQTPAEASFASRSAGLTSATRGRQPWPTPHGQAARKRQPAVQAPTALQLNRLLPRLRRAQSVPNMRVRTSTESLIQPAVHRLMLPPHLVNFLASLQRPGATVSDANSIASSSNSPSPLPIMIAPATSSNTGEAVLHQSRSRDAGRKHNVYMPPLHPPITRHTLRELDLAEILKNPQLRHDVVFDANVQFRPNFDGERGKKKKEACEKYWTAVTREIELGCTCTSFEGQRLLPCICGGSVAARSASQVSSAAMTRGSKSGSGSCSKLPADKNPPSRVPVLVQELRAICLSILPGSNGAAHSPISSRSPTGSSMAGVGTPLVGQSGGTVVSSDHSVLASTLDPVFISQQLAHGVLDVPGLVSFLASVLQLHCAPMRDEMIDEMVQETKRGRIGKGLRMCFEILELMKLDIANHQLRSARPYLVETAVEFEARWFRDQIVGSRMALDRTTAWFSASWRDLASQSSTADCRQSRTALISQAYNDGFLRLIFDPPGTDTNIRALHSRAAEGPSLSSSSLNHSYSAAYPETFQFDAFRLMTFHNDAVDLTIIYMLLMLFRQLSCSPAIAGSAPLPATASTSANISKVAATLASKQLESVKNEVWCLLNEANAAMSRSESSAAADPDLPASLSGVGTGGKAKLTDPRWRSAMKDAVLQVAARAGAVWDEAAGISSTCATRAPSTQTIAMLESWLQTNLTPQSALMKLCLGRLRGVLGSLIAQKVVGSASAVAGASVVAAALSNETNEVVSQRKRAAENAPDTSAKRHKGDEAVAESNTVPAPQILSTTECAVPKSQPRCSPSSSKSSVDLEELEQTVDGVTLAVCSGEDDEWERSLTKAGLDPLRSEVRVLGARMLQVAAVNLKTFRVLYERLAV
ncbi:hypothetical protein BCV69DRAFT_300978 [Microstroma glucosiphilum]|uniref:Tcp11-domain-containing protein n=1 Tax=Pseudomicrostroma glucosiphilum TaxID=1684307 RepID=A0A316U7A2_9BASI|nr:hypothetical protein BCV69DRAFT_300978 [Pseudomicrostroma glucosiphilum]PWN18825.1 hypothetical protein BCV69DRAFT_300978 [Pseudomicrostroma glucosiphilum]